MSQVCLYCTCKGQLSARLAPEVLARALPEGMQLVVTDAACDRDSCLGALAGYAGTEGIVVAACSATARGLSALRVAREVAPAVLVDVREGCLWGGEAGPERTEQAVDCIAMAGAGLSGSSCCEAASVEAVAEAESGASARVLVIGAGPAGLAAASVLTDFGVLTTLVDRRPVTGGMLNQIGLLFPEQQPVATLLAPLERKGETLDTRLGVTVAALRPAGTRFAATLKQGAEVTELLADAVVFATGGQPLLPGTRYRAKEVKGVISQMELETQLTAVEKGAKAPETLPQQVVCIQCTGAREDDAPYCSAICCPTAIKNALRLKTLRPDAAVTILHRNIVMPGIALEALYRKAMAAGVRFVLFTADLPPDVQGEGSVSGVLVQDAVSHQQLLLPAERVVCSTPLRAAPTTEPLARGLGLRLDDMAFVCGTEPVQPLETGLDGVYVCGSARWPAYATQAVEQGRSAGLRAVQHLRGMRSRMWEGPIAADRPAVSEPSRCSGCGRCVESCPYDACQLIPDAGAGMHMEVSTERCRRCGSCIAVCPCGAVTLASGMQALREVVRVAARGVKRDQFSGEGRKHD